MCIQLVERYSNCRCLYHRHSIDPCELYGQHGHRVQEKTVNVGHFCPTHNPASSSPPDRGPETLKSGSKVAESQVVPGDLKSLEADSVRLHHISRHQPTSIVSGSPLKPLLPPSKTPTSPQFPNPFQIANAILLSSSSTAAEARPDHQGSVIPFPAESKPIGYRQEILIKSIDLDKFVQYVKDGMLPALKDIPGPNLEPKTSLHLLCPEPLKVRIWNARVYAGGSNPPNGLELLSLDGYRPMLEFRNSSPEYFEMYKYPDQSGWARHTAESTKSPQRQEWCRMRYRCRCGEELYDEFDSIRAAIKCAANMQLPTQTLHGQREKTFGQRIQEAVTQASRFFRLFGKEEPKPSLPIKDPCVATEPNGGIRMRNSTELQFLLMCLNYEKWTPSLVRENACSINGDKDLFKILTKRYHERPGIFPSWSRLKSLKTLKFVQFEVFQNDLISITKVPDLPPVEKKAEYRPCYWSCDTPMGENLLMYYLHYPDHADDHPVWLDRIPKKLHQRLTIDADKRSNIGWGMQFVEGLDYFKLCVFGLVGLSISVLFGVIWSVLRHDVQGGFGITACLMMFWTFTIGLIQAAAGVT
jgi:hypothetical protein